MQNIVKILLHGAYVGCIQFQTRKRCNPFDRLLIAQATIEDVVIVSNGPMFPKYTDKVVW